jgi:hypothetical protein
MHNSCGAVSLNVEEFPGQLNGEEIDQFRIMADF